MDERRIALDVTHFPLVLLDMGRVGRPPDDLHAMFESFRAIRQRCAAERTRWILVATAEDMPTAVERKILIEESNKLSRAEHELCAACVAVISNGFVRGMITLLGWMIPNVSPLVAAPNTDAAVEMAVDRIRKLGIPYPAELGERAARWFRRGGSPG